MSPTFALEPNFSKWSKFTGLKITCARLCPYSVSRISILASCACHLLQPSSMENAHAAAEVHSEVDVLTKNTEVTEIAAQLFQTWEATWLPSGGNVTRLD